MNLKELIQSWESRLKEFEARPSIAKGMDAKTAMGVQHGRTTALKQCLNELKNLSQED